MKVRVSDVEFDVEYHMDGLLDQAELEEVIITIGGVEVSNVLDDKVLKQIDDACYEDYWKDGPDTREPEDFEQKA